MARARRSRLPDLAPGAVLGERFEIAGVLGRGGMATVYLAHDRVRGSQIALKVLHGHLADQPAARARLRREVEAAGRIRHPAALVASELFELDGHLALSLPLHDGETLAEHVAERGPLPADALWRLGEDLSGALAEAHRKGVLHRDLAPGNIMMDRQRRGVLTDFGLARLDNLVTRSTTTAVGTAGFTAPEVLSGERPGPAADLYGLGCVLYLAATGRAPFEAPSTFATLKRQSEGAFTPIRELRPGLPEALCASVEALLRPTAAERPESAAEVQEAFSRREGPRATPGPRPREPQGAPSAPPSPPPDAKLLPSAPRLPAGASTVILRERHEHHDRRRRLRRGHRHEQAGLEGLVVGIAEKVETAVRAAAGLPQGKPAEVLLTQAVAEEAGLPPEALSAPRVLMERRFRLVDGVSEDAAHRLADVASSLGFYARVRTPGQATASQILAWIAGSLMLLLVGGALVIGGPADLVLLPMMAIVAVAVVTLLIVSAALRGHAPSDARLPLAFPADLSRMLSPGWAIGAAATAAPVNAAAAPPPTSAASAPPALPLSSRVAERLSALDQAIQDSAGRLPAPAVLDLRETLEQLRGRAQAIEAELKRVVADLATHDPSVEEAAAARISARLERDSARARVGQAMPDEERLALERALSAHQDRVLAAEADEQRIVQLEAALLEISAAADRCRRGIVDTPDPARSVEDLIGQLRRDQTRASDAIDEVTRRRAAAAAARQRMG